MQTGDKVIYLDAWCKNPMPVTVHRITPTGGVICKCRRDMAWFVPAESVDRRILHYDLFGPIMPWENA